MVISNKMKNSPTYKPNSVWYHDGNNYNLIPFPESCPRDSSHTVRHVTVDKHNNLWLIKDCGTINEGQKYNVFKASSPVDLKNLNETLWVRMPYR